MYFTIYQSSRKGYAYHWTFGPVMWNFLLEQVSCNWTGLTFSTRKKSNKSYWTFVPVTWCNILGRGDFLLDKAFGPVLFGKTVFILEAVVRTTAHVSIMHSPHLYTAVVLYTMLGSGF